MFPAIRSTVVRPPMEDTPNLRPSLRARVDSAIDTRIQNSIGKCRMQTIFANHLD